MSVQPLPASKPATLARWALGCSIAAICALTFVWPFAVSPDPSGHAFKVTAIFVLITFLTSIAAILVDKACKARRT